MTSPDTASVSPSASASAPAPASASGAAAASGVGSEADLPPRLGNLTFHGPLSETRATRMIDRLAAAGPADVLDIGCGWGELLLRLLEAAPGAKGTGIDINTEDIARGRALAEQRGLAERALFVEESALGTDRGPVDAVLCLGSSQALCDPSGPHDPAAALRELRRLVRPGGRVVLGEGFWERTPTEDELARMWPGAHTGDHLTLDALVDLAIEAGFRPAWIETASREEWEEFESGYRHETEVWLAAHPDHPRAAEIRERVDRQRASWLSGYRTVLGIAYLTLVAVR